jgi:predicted CopG family antitoxin
MQIEIDFECFKALTVLRRSEEDSYSDVVRRLLNLAESELEIGDQRDRVIPANKNIIANIVRGESRSREGAWIGNVHFPNGTRFRATYKGQTFRAEIRDNVWVDENGTLRQSPSEAASKISGTNVNGWRFWYGLRPGDDDWRRLDEFRK